MKLEAAKRDLYRRLAREEGFRSRAAFKLLQLDKKYRFLAMGLIIVDFGCAPGGWLQVASEKVGLDGFVLGLDLEPTEPLPHCKTVVADVRDPNLEEIILANLPRLADVILSDISQRLSGVWEVDHAKQIELTAKIISLFPKILKKEGSALLKVFEGEMLTDLIDGVSGIFEDVRLAKPPASRARSSEIYLMCKRYSGFQASFSFQH